MKIEPAAFKDLNRAIRSRLAEELPPLSSTLVSSAVDFDIFTESYLLVVTMRDASGQLFEFHQRLHRIELEESKQPLKSLATWLNATVDGLLESVRAHNARKKEQAKDAALAALGET